MQLVELAERDRPGPGPTLAGGLLQVALWTVVFLATCAAFSSELPPPPDSALSAKLAWFAERKDDVDTIFLGPSTVYRHVDPTVFDDVMAERDRPTRSFNFGVAGMAALETRVALQRVLDMEPRRLRFVFVELSVIELDIAEANVKTSRVTFWHDLASTWTACRLVLASDRPWDFKLDALLDHIQAFAYHLVNAGLARAHLEKAVTGRVGTGDAARAADATFDPAAMGADGDGFLALDDDHSFLDEAERRRLRQRRAALERDAEAWKRQRAARRREGRETRPLDATEAALIADFVERIEAAGARPVFFTSPDVKPRFGLLQAAEDAGIVPVLLDLGDPARYPHLFALDIRYDWNHLDGRGAARYSRALAHAFADHLDATGAPP